MKIQIEHYDEAHTFETSREAITSSDMVVHLYRLLLAVGYEKVSVDEAFLERAEEIELVRRKNHE
jgi:hypothetical protein